MIRLSPLILMAALSAAAPPRAGDPQPLPGEAGRYELVSAGEDRPWQLPVGGDAHNGCRDGNVRAIHWSGDGKFLVSEVSDKEGIGLCLYDLRAFSFAPEAKAGAEPPPRSVELRPLTNAGLSSRYAGVQAPGSSSGGISEYEFSWAPPQGRIHAPPLAFSSAEATLSQRGKSGRVIGATAQPLADAEWRLGALDGQGQATTTDGVVYYQPAWVPPGSSEGSLGIAMVSNLKLSCGKERIVYFPSAQVNPKSSVEPFLVTQPCTVAAGDPLYNTGDRYPTISPKVEDDRLAFIRVTPGERSQVCVASGLRALGTQGNVRCWFKEPETKATSRFAPTWSPDGRYLLYYVTTEDAGSASRSTRLEVLDLSEESPTPRVLLKGVRPNPAQASAVLGSSPSGVPYALAILEGEDRLVAVPLTGGESKALKTGLQNLVAAEVVESRRGSLLAIVAQGYDIDGDLKRDKPFISKLDVSGW